MENAAKIYFPDGKITDLVVGQDGVKKIFAAKEKPNSLIVLTDEGILEYVNMAWLLSRDYASAESKKNKAA